MRGDLSTAEGELLAAANLLRERPAPLAAWRIWAALGAVRKRRNDADGARQAYRQSSTILDQIAANIAEGELRAKFLGADAATRVRSALEDLS
jgi:Flp pilus assembly protein TadD